VFLADAIWRKASGRWHRRVVLGRSFLPPASSGLVHRWCRSDGGSRPYAVPCVPSVLCFYSVNFGARNQEYVQGEGTHRPMGRLPPFNGRVTRFSRTLSIRSGVADLT
jgi:hypothetical protein